MPEKLMVVEDEVHLAEVIAENLELEGFDVEVVNDGAEALEAIRTRDPELVLLDMKMPKKDGFEVLEALRRAGPRPTRAGVTL